MLKVHRQYSFLKTQKNLILIFVMFLSGCVTLNKEGLTVNQFSGEPSFDCKFMGSQSANGTEGFTREQDKDSAVNEILNKAGKMGAKWAQITSVNNWGNHMVGGTNVSGNLYMCPPGNMENKNNCISGDASACLKYSKASFISENYSIGFKYLNLGCKMENKESCDAIEKANEFASGKQKKCNKGDGDACAEYGQFLGLNGNEIMGIVFVKKGCKLKSNFACDLVSYIEESQKQKSIQLTQQNQNAYLANQNKSLELQTEQIRQQKNRNMMENLNYINQIFNHEQNRMPSQKNNEPTTCYTEPVKDTSGTIISYRSICR